MLFKKNNKTPDYSDLKGFKKINKSKRLDKNHHIGLYYYYGICVPKNLIHAFEYFLKSYNSGYTESSIYIALIQFEWSESGIDSDNNFLIKSKPKYSFEESYQYAKIGHCAGFKDASKILLRIFYKLPIKDNKLFIDSIKNSIETNDPWACAVAIKTAVEGEKSLMKGNIEDTIQYYLNKGGTKSSLAHLYLSKHYDMNKKQELAIYHMIESAKLGNPEACFAYGVYIYKSNKEESENYIRKSANMNYPIACGWMGDLYRKTDNYNKIESVNWYKKAIELNHTPSMIALAGMSLENMNTSKIMEKSDAIKLIKQASELGNELAHKILLHEGW